MTGSPTPLTSAREDALQARLAMRWLAPLDAVALPHDIEQRLRFARERAVTEAAAQRRRAAQAGAVFGTPGSAAVLAGPPWWQKLASALPLVVLVCGLVLIQQSKNAGQIDAAAEIDTILLADELPPAAYTDPGFAEFLKSPVE